MVVTYLVCVYVLKLWNGVLFNTDYSNENAPPDSDQNLYIYICLFQRKKRGRGGRTHVSKIKENVNIFYDYPKAHKVNS